ncbi:hypothetical protein [Candidatus Synchoanobacter obligatus]|uniref:Uncharacterized protein n=1 Tax=Candidatus Synchoanobacter obligatus TaxID=2919597 RepID=A0ABT1L5M5_9GAMM|nr:hypothetical protein [Candidatus Synchoanobacter obligatus]MCP8352173.1 hypothetical protein [Candidatus Synchoanobacter obligatus]
MKVYDLTIVLLFLGLFFATIEATAPIGGWFGFQALLVDRLYRFVDVMIHVMGFAALIKYLFAK